jgi:hypothetical protein
MSGNVRKYREPIMVPSIVDANGDALGGGGGAGVSAEQPYVSADANSSLATQDWPILSDVITVAGLAVSITAGSRAGTVEIVTNPAGAAKLILGAAMTLNIVQGGAWAGTEVTQISLGTVTNTNSTLSGLEEAVLASDDVGVTGDGTLTQNSSDNTNTNQLTPKLELLAGGSIWLNCIVDVGVTDDIVLTGTIEIFYIDLD